MTQGENCGQDKEFIESLRKLQRRIIEQCVHSNYFQMEVSLGSQYHLFLGVSFYLVCYDFSITSQIILRQETSL